METEGTIEIAARPRRIRAALRDPEVLAAVLPSCRAVVPRGEDRFEATFVRALGPTTLTLAATLDVATDDAGREILTLSGRSLVTGAVRAICVITATPQGSASTLCYHLTLELSGLFRRLAEVAAPDAIHGAAARLMDRFAAAAGRPNRVRRPPDADGSRP